MLWPFNRKHESVPAPEPTCQHGRIHVVLYDCPDCHKIIVTTTMEDQDAYALLKRTSAQIRNLDPPLDASEA